MNNRCKALASQNPGRAHPDVGLVPEAEGGVGVRHANVLSCVRDQDDATGSTAGVRVVFRQLCEQTDTVSVLHRARRL